MLELRLKEQAQALEQARLRVDGLWDEMMLAARARELFNRYLKNDAAESMPRQRITWRSWPAQPP